MSKIKLSESQLTAIIRESIDELDWRTKMNAQKGIIKRVDDYREKLRNGEGLSDEEAMDYNKKKGYLTPRNMKKYDNSIQADIDAEYGTDGVDISYDPIGTGSHSEFQGVDYSFEDKDGNFFDGSTYRPIDGNRVTGDRPRRAYSELSKNDEIHNGRAPREIGRLHKDLRNFMGGADEFNKETGKWETTGKKPKFWDYREREDELDEVATRIMNKLRKMI